jgi:hypothetical protein
VRLALAAMRSRRASKSLLICAVATVAAITEACPPSDPHVDIGMTDSTFVQTMVRLRRIAEDTLLDSLARDSARHMALRDSKVTVVQMDSAARLLAREPKRADTLWKTIDAQVARRQMPLP